MLESTWQQVALTAEPTFLRIHEHLHHHIPMTQYDHNWRDEVVHGVHVFEHEWTHIILCFDPIVIVHRGEHTGFTMSGLNSQKPMPEWYSNDEHVRQMTRYTVPYAYAPNIQYSTRLPPNSCLDNGFEYISARCADGANRGEYSWFVWLNLRVVGETVFSTACWYDFAPPPLHTKRFTANAMLNAQCDVQPTEWKWQSLTRSVSYFTIIFSFF
jgi:hypothetical protein